MSRRRKKTPPARCGLCKAPIRWLTYAGDWRKFHPVPLRDPRSYTGPPAYPVEARRAWRLDRLVVELMGRRECTETEARAEAYDMPWHAIHTCNDPHPAAAEEGQPT